MKADVLKLISSISEISAEDRTTLEKLFNDFATSIKAGKFEEAYSVFSPGAKMISTNKLLGESPQTISDKKGENFKVFSHSDFGLLIQKNF